MTAPALFVGSDAAQEVLDRQVRPTGLGDRVATDEAGIAALVRRPQAAAPAALVREATGGCEVPVVAARAAAGLTPAVVNPRPARRFAEGVGRRAQTDPLDAAIRAPFAAAVRPQPRPVPDAAARAGGDLRARRRPLVGMRGSAQHRLPPAAGVIRTNIPQHRPYLGRPLRTPEAQRTAAVKARPGWRPHDALLQAVPGVGPQVSRPLRAERPELGTTPSRKRTALGGRAPFKRASGRRCGPRSIRGGRAHGRAALYQAAGVALRFNAPLQAVYERLRARGKAKKVALIAGARRLLVIRNALVRTRTPWKEKLALST